MHVDSSPHSRSPAGADDGDLLDRLRRGDEAAFTDLVRRYHASMSRMARLYVASEAAAEEVVQQAWLGVIQGLSGFEGRGTLKAWIFSIVANRARARGVRDKRMVPFSSLDADGDASSPSVDTDRFLDDSHPRWAGHWSHAPEPWSADALVAQETVDVVRAAIDELPPAQRAVITIRDVEGLDAEEACDILAISDANQRVLLHRARAKVRKVLESYMQGMEASS